MSASPYAGAGFPPTFAIPQAAGTQTLDLGPQRRLCMPTHLSVALLPRAADVGAVSGGARLPGGRPLGSLRSLDRAVIGQGRAENLLTRQCLVGSLKARLGEDEGAAFGGLCPS